MLTPHALDRAAARQETELDVLGRTMTKIKALVAAALITVPVLALDAAQLPMPSGSEQMMSDPRPTTANVTCCLWVYWNGMFICIAC